MTTDDRVVSLRALIADRKTKDIRRTYTHTFCLVPDLVTEYNALEEELQDLPSGSEDSQAGSRMVSPRARLEKEHKAKAKAVQDASVSVVFKTTKRGQFSALQADWEANKTKTDEQFAQVLTECFDHFEDVALTKDDFIDMMAAFEEGEFYSAAANLIGLINTVVDVPKFVKQSSGQRK